MKKIILILILGYGQLYGLDQESTLKFYHHLFHALYDSKNISVYSNDAEYNEVFSHSTEIKLVSSPYAADFVLITKKSALPKVLAKGKLREHIPSDTIVFVTDYRLLKASKDIVGAFYWKKGRSQLLFIKNRLNAKHISLPNEYNKYIIDAL